MISDDIALSSALFCCGCYNKDSNLTLARRGLDLS